LGGHQTVNFRTTTELEANPFFLDPHAATAKQVGELLRDIYTTKLLTAESRDYLLNIMSNALPWNREGLGLGLPSSIQFANKIGFLWTDADLNFVDSAIVWGNNTDYVVVVLDRNVDWESGKYALMEISRLVYAALDV
jgi:beta-lactamase class A